MDMCVPVLISTQHFKWDKYEPIYACVCVCEHACMYMSVCVCARALVMAAKRQDGTHMYVPVCIWFNFHIPFL